MTRPFAQDDSRNPPPRTFLDRLTRRYSRTAYLIVVLCVYVVLASALALALTPAVLWWRWVAGWSASLPPLGQALAIALGAGALLFWLVQAAYAVFLLEAINYIEHYGLERSAGADGRPEPFAMQHAWNADHALTNCFIANLQRHSDHHMHAWKPYATLEALPGPQLPTGYAGCLFLASVPRLWFRAMQPRLAAL